MCFLRTTSILLLHIIQSGSIFRHPSQCFLSLVDQPLNLESCIASRELLQQLPSSLAFLTLHVEFLHAHNKPPRLIYAYTPVFNHQALAKHQVVTVRQLLMERDGGVRACECCAQLELGERCEEKGRCILVWVRELEVMKLRGLLSLTSSLLAFRQFDGYLSRDG